MTGSSVKGRLRKKLQPGKQREGLNGKFSITVLLAGEETAGARDALADVGKRAQVRLLGLVPVLPH